MGAVSMGAVSMGLVMGLVLPGVSSMSTPCSEVAAALRRSSNVP
jgi:hypothetical protein